MKLHTFLVLSLATSCICLAIVYGIMRKHTHNGVDFDTSMRLSESPSLLNSETDRDLYAMFKNLYNKNYVSHVTADQPYKIPKIIHQIWLGSPFPEKYKAFQQSWLANHPDWQYKLWTEKEIEEFGLHNKQLYDYAVNYGEKSDIARYEILYRYGGVYVDTDFESYKALDDLHKSYDFYIGIQPLDTHHVQLGIGIIGARPKHTLLQLAIQKIGEKQKIPEPIVLRTGPLFFTVLFYHVAPQCRDRVIALPASFVYPMGYNEKISDKNKWMRPEALANHHWAGSWLSDDAFVKEH